MPEEFSSFDYDKFLSYSLYNTDNTSGKFFIIENLSRFYIIAIYSFETQNKLVKRAFNTFGLKVTEVFDEVIPNPLLSSLSDDDTNMQVSNTILVRKKPRETILFDTKNNIISYSRTLLLPPIKKYYKLFHSSYLPNQSFGTLDIETYTGEDNISYVYCLGFYIPQENLLKTFYINKEDLSSPNIVHTCFNELLKPKFMKKIFYVHNQGKFDSIFILKNLVLYNEENSLKNPYYFEAVFRNKEFLKIVVKRVIDGKIRHVTLHDSIAILDSSLDNLSKTYDLSVKKGFFPYDFVRKNTLFYKGVTPNITYYTDKLDLDVYNSLVKQDWDLKEQTLIYLEKDLKSLHEVLSIVNKQIHKLFKIQMTESLTISSLAVKYFIQSHYNLKNKPLPLIRLPDLYNNLHNAFYGARVEVYRPYGRNLYYYDVNSLYPFASLNDLCGLNYEYIKYLLPQKFSKDLFGFFHCKIDTSSTPIKYLGLLPVRGTGKALLTFPIGKWEGMYFSEELKFVQEYGYKIEVLSGYKFNRVENVFNSFVNSINNIKMNPENNHQKQVAKLLMNSSIGRFGMDPFKPIHKLVNSKDLLSIIKVYNVIDQVAIGKDLHFVIYDSNIDKTVCLESGLDYIEVLNKRSVKHQEPNKESDGFESITTAAAILSYARIHMMRVMIYIIENGGKLYYTDTDSLVTDIKLPESMVDPKKLGYFKLEHTVEEGYFLAEKTYCLKLKQLDQNGNNKIVIKAKGVLSDNLTFEDFVKMYDEGYLKNAKKRSSIKELSLGSVTIETKDVSLNLSYKKRNKVIINNK